MRRAPVVPPLHRRARRGAGWLIGAALLSHLGAGWLPAQVTPAAAGTSAVSLVDDRNGAALFASTGLRPGSAETACVALTVTGAAQSFGDVGLSAEVTQADLAPYLLVTVERGTLGDPASCASFSGQPVWTGTLAQLPGTTAAGVPTGWQPGVVPTMAYRFTVTVLDDPRAQDLGASAAFVWSLDVEPAPDPAPRPEPPADPAPAPAPEPVAPPPPAPAPTPSAPRTTPPATTTAPAPSATPEAPGAPEENPSPTPAPPATDPTGAPPADDGDDGGGTGDAVQAPPLAASPSTVAQVAAAVGETALAVVNDGQFPLALVAVVVGFLSLQGRLDRRDPKLALARVRQDLTDFSDFPEIPRTATP